MKKKEMKNEKKNESEKMKRAHQAILRSLWTLLFSVVNVVSIKKMSLPRQEKYANSNTKSI